MMSISGIYAITNQTTVKSFDTGIVNIDLKEYRLDQDNQEVEYNDEDKIVMPGDVVSLILKVDNLGADCYIRMKLSSTDNIDFNNSIGGLSDNWKKYGDYYYYDGVFKSNETLKIFDTIQIPVDMTNNNDNEKIKLEIIVQAIQSKNFEPDYTLEDPWKDIKPEECINKSYNINESNNSSKVTIKYENDTNTNISVPNNFFESINNVMPGDSFSENIEIKNNNKKHAKYYLEINSDEGNERVINLLKQINFVITNKDGKVLYDGKLLSNEKILLGNYNLNDEDKLEFKISIPNELGNEYSILNSEFALVFSAEYNDENVVESGGKNISITPKTGDTIDIAIIIFFISTIGLIVVMLLGYREKNKEDL